MDYGEKDLNNEHTAGGIPPSSKSRSKRTPAVRAYHHRNRRNDAATRIPQSKRPNAQKHGIFSVAPTIPGEDPREFQELHSALVDEWKPSGPTEEDAVFSLADLMWRKLRAQRFLRAKLIVNTHDPRNPAFDERRSLLLFVHFMRLEPETAFQQRAGLLLSANNNRHLTQKFPRSNYKSASEWAEAVTEEIKSVLLPTLPSLEAPEPREDVDNSTERLMVAEALLAASITYASETLEHDLGLRERLDAMIARQVKHLIQTKAMKQMLRQASAREKTNNQKNRREECLTIADERGSAGRKISSSYCSRRFKCCLRHANWTSSCMKMIYTL